MSSRPDALDLPLPRLVRALRSWRDRGLLTPPLSEVADRLDRHPSDARRVWSREVLITTKASTFGDPAWIARLVRAAGPCRRFVPSAGTTGPPMSFRLDSYVSNRRVASMTDSLAAHWGISRNDLFVFNCYPAGITLPAGVSSVDTAARPEVLSAALEMFGRRAPYPLIIAQPHFLRRVVVDGILTPDLLSRAYFVIGGVWTSHGYWTGIGRFAGLPPEELRRRAVSSFGVAEVGLGIGTMDGQLDALRAHLPVGRTEAKPMLFRVDEESYLVETEPRGARSGRVLLTPLATDVETMPLVRYATGDVAEWLELGPRGPHLLALHGRGAPDDGVAPQLVQEHLEGTADSLWVEDFVSTPDGLRVRFHARAPTHAIEDVTERLRGWLKSCGADHGDSVAVERGGVADLARKPSYGRAHGSRTPSDG